VITDPGGEFTAPLLKKAVARLGAQQRFASGKNLHATARLERFWRSLKESARFRRLMLPLTCADLDDEGLGGATPAEVFVGSQNLRNRQK
jgi:hypothetical protein